MIRAPLIAIAVLLLTMLAAGPQGQDNPVLRERLAQKIVEDLSKHNSEETAWHSEKSVNKQKWTKGKLLGKEIRLASWTEQSKSWIWLVDPKGALSVDLRHLAIHDGRLEFAAAATARARFKAWGRIPKFAQASVGGTVTLEIEIEGSAAIAAGHLEKSQITTLRGKLHDLQFNNDLAHPMEPIVEDSLNKYLEDENDKLRRSLEKAIDRVHF